MPIDNLTALTASSSIEANPATLVHHRKLSCVHASSAITGSNVFATRVRFGRLSQASVPEQFDDKTINIDLWDEAGWFWLTGFPRKLMYPPLLVTEIPVIPPFSHPVSLSHITATGMTAPSPVSPWKDGLRLYIHL